MPTLHIHRAKANWKDLIRAYKIVVDGDELARVRNGQSIALELAPGEHEIHARIDWTRSNSVVVALTDGEPVHLGVANNVSLWRFTQGVRGIVKVLVAEKDSYLKLGPIDPP